MKNNNKVAATELQHKVEKKQKSSEIFEKENYKFILIGVVIIFLGYLLMIGGKSSNAAVFNEAEIYSFRRITLSPIIITIGFAVVFFGILKNPKSTVV